MPRVPYTDPMGLSELFTKPVNFTRRPRVPGLKKKSECEKASIDTIVIDASWSVSASVSSDFSHVSKILLLFFVAGGFFV